MRFLIIGSSGRFASKFINKLSDYYVEEVPFNKLFDNSDLDDSFTKSKCFDFCIWTAGPGTSHLANSSKELQGLEVLSRKLSNGTLQIGNFVYLSTGGMMYGKNPGEIYEDCTPLPIDVHGSKKLSCEQLIQNSMAKHLDAIRILRLGNAYSKFSVDRPPKGIIENLQAGSFEREPLQITCSLSSLRQYASHDDFTTFIIESVLLAKNKLSAFEIINIAPNFSYSIQSLINIFEKKFYRTIDFRVINHVRDDVILKSEKVDNSKFNWNSIENNLDFWLS
jgi:nucleoside-diphosphate-sugar epimerase